MKNIIFDLGGVVLSWQPEELIKKVFSGEEKRRAIKKEIFGHPDWIELDRGTLDEKNVIERAAKRTGEGEQKIKELIQLVAPSLKPVDKTVRIIEEVKEKGHPLYILSNMPRYIVDYLETRYTFSSLFDGKVYSSLVNMVKPDQEIFYHILNHYQLQPEETIFIDDTAVNIQTAVQLGLTPIHFESPGQCREELKKLGCL